MDFFEDLGRKISDTAETIGKKTEEVIEVQKLKNQMYAAEKEMNRSLRDLGKLVFTKYEKGETVPEEYWAFCDEVQVQYNKIKEMKDDLAQLKGKKRCGHCQAVVPEESAFCGSCGAKVDD